MIDWLASKILISYYKSNFLFHLWRAIMNFLWVTYKKCYWDSKMHPSLLTPLVLSIFISPGQLWGVITLERVISLCWNFQGNLMSYIHFIWKKFHQNLRWVMSQPLKFWSIWHGMAPLLFYIVVKNFTIPEFSRGNSKPGHESRITTR